MYWSYISNNTVNLIEVKKKKKKIQELNLWRLFHNNCSLSLAQDNNGFLFGLGRIQPQETFQGKLFPTHNWS